MRASVVPGVGPGPSNKGLIAAITIKISLKVQEKESSFNGARELARRLNDAVKRDVCAAIYRHMMA